MNNKIPWERIIKELKQEISLDEQADLDRWKAVENNRALYEEFVQLWNTLMFERMTQPSRADKCWEKMEKRYFSFVRWSLVSRVSPNPLEL